MNGKRVCATVMKYAAAMTVGALMARAVLDMHGGLAGAATAAERYKILCDACTIPGVVFTLGAVLVVIANQGMFYGITYALSYAIRMLIPGMSQREERYGDYVTRKQEKGGVRGFGFLAVTGGLFLALALVFLALYYANR